MNITVDVKAKIEYQYKYTGDLEEKEVNKIIEEKYHGNLWIALKDGLISDIDYEEPQEILTGRN